MYSTALSTYKSFCCNKSDKTWLPSGIIISYGKKIWLIFGIQSAKTSTIPPIKECQPAGWRSFDKVCIKYHYTLISTLLFFPSCFCGWSSHVSTRHKPRSRAQRVVLPATARRRRRRRRMVPWWWTINVITRCPIYFDEKKTLLIPQISSRVLLHSPRAHISNRK